MKRIIAIVLVLTWILSATACGDVPENDAPLMREADVIADELTPIDASTRAYARVTAIDDAFVRDGKYADQCMDADKKASGKMQLKNESAGYRRDILLKFDISKMDLSEMKTVQIALDFTTHGGDTRNGNDLYLLAYAIDSGWKSETVTFNTAPRFTEDDLAGRGHCVGAGVCYIDVTDYVLACYSAGKHELSFRILQSDATLSQGEAMSIVSADTVRHPKLFAKSSAPDLAYETVLSGSDTVDRMIWNHADAVYKAWYARYLEIVEAGDFDAEMIESDPKAYSLTVEARDVSPDRPVQVMPTRLVSTLPGYREKIYEVNRYGSVISDVRYEATGRFYTKEVDGRWWLVDPEGYPCHIQGTNHLKYAYSSSAYQTSAMERTYGSAEKWAIAASRWLRDDLYMNLAHNVDPAIMAVEEGVPYFASPRGISKYASERGLNSSDGGATNFLYNDAMPTFDPDFETFVDENVKKTAEEMAGDPYCFGYITDNELPVSDNLLYQYLTLDYTVPENYYSYAAAWKWLINITGDDKVTINDVPRYSERLGVDLLDLFKGFVYDRYYSLYAQAIEKYDPGALYLGVRLLCGSKKQEWLMRTTGYWCDIMCINYYHQWEIDEQTLYDFGRWLGIPMMVTEFYAKGQDAIASDGKPFANQNGAGWVVKTQEEKGYFYQNYTLRLLECKFSIGWLYFQYIDNDPTDPSVERGQSDSNKGMVNSDLDTEVYADFTDQMALINRNVYGLIEYFDGERYFE